MPRVRATAGQLLVNSMLPEDLRDYNRQLDKASMKKLFKDLAEKYPEKYEEISSKMLQFGGDTAYAEGSGFSLDDLRTAESAKTQLGGLKSTVQGILADPSLDATQKRERIVAASSDIVTSLAPAVMAEAEKNNNNYATYAKAGARGNASELNQMIGSPVLMMDHRQRPVPIPIFRNYADGLDPAELWATSFGVRKGYIDVKMATPKAGYLNKQLSNAAHKLLVTRDAPLEGTGMLVDADDMDNIGSVLARKVGKYDAGTTITPRIAKDLMGEKGKILVYSPIAGGTANGVPMLAAGIRERGEMPQHGENIGMAAAHAIGEPMAQAQISAKHIGGVAGGGGKGTSLEAQSAFSIVQRMVNPPKEYADYAPVVGEDGVVGKVTEATQGGSYIQVGSEKYYVPVGQEITVKPGDTIEAGDALSSGMPNPTDVVKHKGIGEGRAYMVDRMRDLFQRNKLGQNRRNIELMVRGLVNNVRITDPTGRLGYLPDDSVEYDALASRYEPRPGSTSVAPGMAMGQYLEKPVLHYSIGTRITPRVAKTLKEQGIEGIVAHKDVPEFEPDLQRAVDTLAADDDWMVGLSGFNLQRNFQKSLYANQGTTMKGLSHIPRLARGLDFSRLQQEAVNTDQTELRRASGAWEDTERALNNGRLSSGGVASNSDKSTAFDSSADSPAEDGGFS